MTTGSCLCGAVTYEFVGSFEGFFLCHCSRCRKNSGSAHAANLVSTTGRIIWPKGETGVTSFRLTGTRHERSFCSSCGSALPSTQMDGALVIVPAGSLDTEIGMRPTAHICLADRAAWDDRLETVPGLQGLPGEP